MNNKMKNLNKVTQIYKIIVLVVNYNQKHIVYTKLI